MGLADLERKMDEKIDGMIYDTSPSPGFDHGIVNNNIHINININIKQGLKNSVCLPSS